MCALQQCVYLVYWITADRSLVQPRPIFSATGKDRIRIIVYIHEARNTASKILNATQIHCIEAILIHIIYLPRKELNCLNTFRMQASTLSMVLGKGIIFFIYY